MIHTDPVTARWASALFNLAQEKGQVDAVAGDVAKLEAELSSERVSTFLLGSSVSDEEKLAKFEPVLAGCGPLVGNFVRLLFAKDRVGVLEHLGTAFRARQLESEGTVEGHVETVRTLDDSQVQTLEQSLGARLGKRVLLEQRIVPELVGGVRIFIGASMIDQSVQGRLESLRRKMVEAPLPS